MWSVSQRRALFVLLAAAAVYVGLRSWREPVDVDDPLRGVGPRASELQQTMNPNTATAAMLETIPGVGPARATAIIDYREKFTAEHPGELAFTKLADLRKIKGFGVATTEKLGAYLRFDGP